MTMGVVSRKKALLSPMTYASRGRPSWLVRSIVSDWIWWVCSPVMAGCQETFANS